MTFWILLTPYKLEIGTHDYKVKLLFLLNLEAKWGFYTFQIFLTAAVVDPSAICSWY